MTIAMAIKYTSVMVFMSWFLQLDEMQYGQFEVCVCLEGQCYTWCQDSSQGNDSAMH